MYNGGFYLIHKEFGVMNRDDTGCYVEYIPAARGSKGPNGEYIWQSDMIQNIETSYCGNLSAPSIDALKVASVSDQGVQLKWAAQNANDNVVLTLSESGTKPTRYENVQSGLSLRLTDNTDRQGDLAANELVFGGAPELIIQNIDMGMLTAPRDGNTMIKNMAKLSADYFQKIPASKLVMADYTAAYFPKVTLPNGKVYTTSSDGMDLIDYAELYT